MSDGVYSYTYDDNGNRLSKSDGSNTWLYEYDFENRLVSVLSAGGAIAEYAYDDDGNRVAETHDGQAVIYLVDTTEPYAQVLEEHDGGGALRARYVYANSIVSREDSNGVLFFHGDHLNSTILLTNETGADSGQYAYDAFGVVRQNSGPGDVVNLFTGERHDVDLSQIYLRARYYDPRVGRFLTRDSWEGVDSIPDTLGAYNYGLASPTQYIDPSGRMLISYAWLNAVGLEKIARYSGYGSFAAGVLSWIGNQFVTDWSKYASLTGYSWTMGFSTSGGMIGRTWGRETLFIHSSGRTATYAFSGVAFSASFPWKSSFGVVMPEVTYWDYGAGGLTFLGLPNYGRGEAFGVEKPSDYTQVFVGWSVGILFHTVGGASSPGIVASYSGPSVTAPIPSVFTLGGSTTYYWWVN